MCTDTPIPPEDHAEENHPRRRPPLTRDDLRSPRWVAAHVGIAVLAVTFILLGRWQWDVGHKVLPLTKQQLAAWNTPVPVGSVLTTGGLDGTKVGQSVQVSGGYDATRQLLVPGRTLNGRTGYYVLAPLVTGSGQAIVVNRGWLSAPGPAEPTIPAPPAGRVTVVGWAAEPESETGLVNQNGIAQSGPTAAATAPDEASVISPAELVNRWPYHLPDGYISATDAASTEGGLTAIPAPLPPHGTSWDLLNIGYAFQWWFFSIVTVCWYTLYWRRELRETATRTATEPESDPDAESDQLVTGESAGATA